MAHPGEETARGGPEETAARRRAPLVFDTDSTDSTDEASAHPSGGGARLTGCSGLNTNHTNHTNKWGSESGARVGLNRAFGAEKLTALADDLAPARYPFVWFVWFVFKPCEAKRA
jgi:hypothetical protein